MNKKINSMTLLILVLVIGLSVTGFTSVYPGQSATSTSQISQDEEPTPEEPQPEQPIYTEEVTAPQPDQGGTSSGNFTTGLLIGLLIAAGVGILVLIGVLIGRGSKKDQSEPPSSQEPPTS
jgi:flagellar basal body-associated protein FliL